MTLLNPLLVATLLLSLSSVVYADAFSPKKPRQPLPSTTEPLLEQRIVVLEELVKQLQGRPAGSRPSAEVALPPPAPTGRLIGVFNGQEIYEEAPDTLSQPPLPPPVGTLPPAPTLNQPVANKTAHPVTTQKGK